MSSLVFLVIFVSLIGLGLTLSILFFIRRSHRDLKPAAGTEDRSLLKQARAAKEKGQYTVAGEIYERLGKLPEAIGMYERAKLYHHIARLYERRSQWENAAEMYERSQNYDKAARCHQQSQNYVKAGQLFQGLGNTRLAAEMYEKGEYYLDAARLYEQEDQFQKAGDMYVILKKYKEAAQQFEKYYSMMKKGRLSDEERSRLSSYARHSGDLYLQAKDLPAAAKIYAEADLAPEAAEAFLRIGDISKAGEFAQRLPDPTRVMEIYEKNGQLAIGLEIAAAMHLRENRPQDAAKLWERAGHLRKAAEALEQGQQFKKAAALYNQLGETQKAASLLETAGEFYEAALLYQRLGHHDETLRLLERAAPTSPSRAEVLLMIGRIHLQQGHLESARDVYRQLVDELPASPADLTPYYELALVIERLGDTKEAISLYEKITRSDPNYRDAKTRHDRLLTPQPTSETDEAKPFSSPDSSAPVLLNRYRLLRRIGQGGCGVVHEGSDLVLNRTVAVKILSGSIEDSVGRLEDFLREARTAAILNHSNIVTIYDTGQSGPHYFIVMEYVNGITIKKLLEDRPDLPLSEVLALTKQACRGLEYAHRKGIVHRDIKPGNILVDEEGNVKITDFGLARFISDTSDENLMKGTPLYMSPEQIQRLRLDHRTDIYSLGCMLYRMVCRRPPFTEGNITQHHVNSPPPPPATFNPAIPGALNRLILKCLEKEPQQRYPDVASLLRDLETIA